VNKLFDVTFEGSTNPFYRMQEILARLAHNSGKRVELAKMVDDTLATQGQFRIQHPNSDSDQFPPHTDTFNQSIYTPRDFERIFSVMAERYSV